MDVYLGGVLLNNLTDLEYLNSKIRDTWGGVIYDDNTEVQKWVGSNITLAFGIGAYNQGSLGSFIIILAVKLDDDDAGNIGKTIQSVYLGNDGEFIMVDNVNYTLDSVPKWLCFVVEIQGQDYSAGGGGQT